MSARLQIEKKLLSRSDRVKCVDLHPTEPWVLASLYNGNVYVWNYDTQNLVKTLEVTSLPVRAVKFIARKNWFVTASDDKLVQVYNYNTLEKVCSFDAHTDYIRSIAVHPTQPLILTCSDDLTIKCWDWEKNWRCVQIFEGHTHYVMHVIFNPKDTNTFASASLDKTIKVWSLGSTSPNYTLDGHDKGVNCVDYYTGADKPYLISGADDRTAKIWDYTTKACVQTLTGHTNNVSLVAFLPDHPFVVTGSEDGWVKVWQLNTYRMATSLNYGLDRAWSIGYRKGSTSLALGFEEGTVVVSLGRENPVASMDINGKLIWSKHNEVQAANIKAGGDNDLNDGDRIMLPVKDLGTCEIYPQTLQHSPNGRFVAVCGDGEYIVYTALAWRNKEFGKALEFVWSHDSNIYATRLGSGLQLFKAFKPMKVGITLEGLGAPEQLFGGRLMGLRTSHGSLLFFDWESHLLVRKIDVVPKQVLWSDTGMFVTLVCEDCFYILQFNYSAFEEYVNTNGDSGTEGVEEAFDVVTDVAETVVTGKWVGDCFIYTSANRLSYLVGGEVNVVAHLDTPAFLLGYLPKEDRVYLMDKDNHVISYTLSLDMLEYQTLVLRGELDAAQALLSKLSSHRSKIAQFLDNQGLKEMALEVSDDPEQRFDLALAIGNLEVAGDIARELDTPPKWKQVADRALAAWDVSLARECLERAKDYPGLLMLYTSLGDTAGLEKLAQTASPNVALLCHLQLNVDSTQILLESEGRLPEATFFTRTFIPDSVPESLQKWKDSHKSAHALADPVQYPNLFPGFKNDEPHVTNGTTIEPPASTNEDTVSEAMSVLSMEVNTTGTDSIRGDIDLESELNVASSETSKA